MKDLHRGLVEDEFPLCRAGGIELPARRRATDCSFAKIIPNFRWHYTAGLIVSGAV